MGSCRGLNRRGLRPTLESGFSPQATAAGAFLPMQIQIHSNGIANSDAINDRLRQEVEAALKVFADQVTRVEAHLHDDNGPKHGQDKRCVLEVRLAGHHPLAVEATDRDLYQAITLATGKAERAVRHKLERHEAHKSSH